jgi:hypothetical protein
MSRISADGLLDKISRSNPYYKERIMRRDQTFTTGGEEPVLAASLELAASKWRVALHDGRRERPAVHSVAEPQAAARLQAVLALIEAHKEKWSLRAPPTLYLAGQNQGPGATELVCRQDA